MRATMSIRSTNVTTGETTQKTYGNIAYQYIGDKSDMGGGTPTPITPLPTDYETFFEWCDAVGRGIISLTTDTYFNSSVTAVFDVNQEIAD